MRDDILARLRIDPGQRTLGQLMQDREAASQEIARLRAKIERLEAQGKAQPPSIASERSTANPDAHTFRGASVVLRLKQVQMRTGLSRSTIYHYVKDGVFPKPVTLGPRAVGWLESEVTEWIAQRLKVTTDRRREQM